MYGYEETIKLIEQLYNNNNEKELITKYKITLQQRIPNLLPTLHKKLNAEAIFSGEFFNLYLTKQYKETKELLLKQVEKTEQWYVFALLLFDKFSDKDLELELEKNNESSVLLKHMKNELNQNIQINNNNIYLELIDEVIKLKEYELFDKISSIKHIFGNGANKQIAIKLTEYFHDEAAIKFFEEYLKKENEQSIHLKVAELYYGLGKYNLAIQYAEKSFTEDNFRPYEIILESALKLGEKDLVKGLVDSLLPYLPESNFLNSLKDIK
jgi:tetratricopeptide (TPR) repeat protein